VELFYFSQACSEDVSNFFPETNSNDPYRFIPELMDVSIYLWLVFTSNLISQTTRLKVKLRMGNLFPHRVPFYYKSSKPRSSLQTIIQQMQFS